MSSSRILIVGANQAGFQVASSLRALGHTGPLTLVGAEPVPPYRRPPLSKEFLAGQLPMEEIVLADDEFYSAHEIDLVLDDRVVELRLESDQPLDGFEARGVAVTASGDRIEFDQLALTVGARPRRLALPGVDLEGVTYLRDTRHAAYLRTELARAETVTVIGGGFIGLEAAAAARAAGKRVVVLEAADRLVGRAVSPIVSTFLRAAHVRRGVEVRLSEQVVELIGHQGRVAGVRLATGEVIASDVVVIGVGVIPRTELATMIDLTCDGGIVVDASGATSRRGVVAAGDCTVAPHPLDPTRMVRLESVQNAIAQAQTAAATLMSKTGDVPLQVPWFWSHQFELKLQMAGTTTGHDQQVVRGEPDGEQFSVLYYRSGRFTGIDAVNRPMDYVMGRKALGAGQSIDAESAGDLARPLEPV